MKFVQTGIAGAYEIRHELRVDDRGRFKRQYCEREFAAKGLAIRWVQVNHSVTLGAGSIRGLHGQRPPHSEAKLVSCPYGRAFDVAVDVRRGSETFMQWAAVEIDEATSFYIPEGCLHGFQTLTDEVHLLYQHSSFYVPDFEFGLRYDDPALDISWPVPVTTVSQRDRSFPFIGDDFEGVVP